MGYAPASIINVAPVPAESGTTLSTPLDTGDRFPAPPFTYLAWPVQTIPSLGVDSEEGTVVAVDGDDFTLVRPADAVALKTGMSFAAVNAIPVYDYGELVTLAATFLSSDPPYKVTLRTPEGGTVILDATDGGAGAASVDYTVEEGGVWYERWEGAASFLAESSFFVKFSEVL